MFVHSGFGRPRKKKSVVFLTFVVQKAQLTVSDLYIIDYCLVLLHSLTTGSLVNYLVNYETVERLKTETNGGILWRVSAYVL